MFGVRVPRTPPSPALAAGRDGVGGGACKCGADNQSPTPTAFAARTRSTLPANGREGGLAALLCLKTSYAIALPSRARWSGHALLRPCGRSRAASRLGPSGIDRCRKNNESLRDVSLVGRGCDDQHRGHAGSHVTFGGRSCGLPFAPLRTRPAHVVKLGSVGIGHTRHQCAPKHACAGPEAASSRTGRRLRGNAAPSHRIPPRLPASRRP